VRKLTRKQVLALSKAQKRRGRKLPKVGYCATLRGSPGQKHVEVCHYYERGAGTKYKHNYYVLGGNKRGRGY